MELIQPLRQQLPLREDNYIDITCTSPLRVSSSPGFSTTAQKLDEIGQLWKATPNFHISEDSQPIRENLMELF